jgi:hypothetical protein
LQRVNPKEGKYVLRIIIKKLRLGFGDQFLLQEFFIAFVSFPEVEQIILIDTTKSNVILRGEHLLT